MALTACGSGGERLSIEPLESPVAAGAGIETADPALAVDPESGDLLLSWIAGDSTNHELYFARSSDAGRSWSAPVRVTDRRGDVHPHGEGSPRLVAGPGGVVALFWNNRILVEGRRFAASDMRFSRSTDGGRSWSPALTLQDDTLEGPRGHTFHGAAWVGDSELVVAWLDGRDREREVARAQASGHGAHAEHSGGGDATIYLARSPDLGATWAAANQRMWDAVCPCCRVTLARGPGGAVTAAWRKHFPGSVRDVVVAPLAAEPGEPLRVAADGWEFPGCPHTGPGAAVDEAGRTHVAWYTGKAGRAGVFYARSSGANGTAAFAEPLALISAETFPVAHPVVAALPDGRALVAYDIGDDGERALVLATVDRQGRQVERTTLPARGADHPQLVALGDGTAVVAWTGEDGAGPRVQLARVRVNR